MLLPSRIKYRKVKAFKLLTTAKFFGLFEVNQNPQQRPRSVFPLLFNMFVDLIDIRSVGVSNENPVLEQPVRVFWWRAPDLM